MTFRLLLSTPDKAFFSGTADSVVLPGSEGYFGVMAHHAQMIAALGLGIVKIQAGNETKLFAVDGGVAEIGPEETVVLADMAIPAADASDAEEKLEETKASRTVPVKLM